MKLNFIEKLSILVTVLFMVLFMGYNIGKGSVDSRFVVETQRSVEEDTVLVGGDRQANESANKNPTELSSVHDDVMVNINTADQQELCILNGVGEVLAGRIIEYRNLNGPFKNIAEIMEVKGIGEGIFAKIQEHITT